MKKSLVAFAFVISSAANAHASSFALALMGAWGITEAIPPVCKIGTGAFILPVGNGDGSKPLTVVSKNPNERLTKDFYPADLAPIPHDYEDPDLIAAGRFDVKTFWEQMRAPAEKQVVAMMDAASHVVGKTSGQPLKLTIYSAFRPYIYQCNVFNHKLHAEFLPDPETAAPPKEGLTEPEAIADVNTRSAYPGESEHQLGTAVDLAANIEVRDPTGAIIKHMGFVLEPEMDTTDEFQWLVENAQDFGFVMSYPKGQVGPKEVNPQTGYVYEPWHWRFIGVPAAKWYHANCWPKGGTTQDFYRATARKGSFSCN